MDLPGQVSYRPVDGAEAGDLFLTRITEQPPRCQQLIPFEQWFPPTKSNVALPTGTTFQSTKSQRNWLYKTHPEAFLGNLDLPSLISEETRAQKSARPTTQTGSLLAVGEIFDLRNSKSSRIAKCPIVAVAAGEAGHILQLSLINPEKWSWNDSVFALGTPLRNFQGSWCSDGSPISKLEFATKLEQHDKLRWLIAQKTSSTTIFEPELRAQPVPFITSMSASDGATADHIVMNPLVTLSMDATGGEAHCDFSFNPGSDVFSPQLAIIDRAGCWSIWRIEREGRGRRKRTKAMLIQNGSWAMPKPVSSDPSFLFETSKIAWITRSSQADDWERDSTPSVQSDSLADGLQNTYAVEPVVSRPKYDGLLMCDHTQLQVSDVDRGRPSSLPDFSRRDGVDTLLDAQTFYGSSSHVLLLTTDNLYLVDVSFTRGQAKSPEIIISCRHSRESSRETLKMSVTKLKSSIEDASSLVSIHSAQSCRVDLFWFIITHRDGLARFHRQVVHFPELNKASKDLNGIESLTAVPLHLSPSKGKSRGKLEEDGQGFTDVQLYQLYALTINLSLSTTIVAITHGARRNLPVPVKEDSLGWTDERRARFLRRKWLRETEQAFVIPDQVEEVRPLSIANVPPKAAKHDTIQLRYYLIRVIREINRGFFGDADGDLGRISGAEYFKPVQEALENRDEGEHVALKPLLGFSNLWKPFDISTLEDEVNFGLRRFKMPQELQFLDCGTLAPKHGIMDLFEKMSVSWSSTIPAEAFKATQWRYMELVLERMAAEVFLSEKGVYMAPQSTLNLAANSFSRDETGITGEYEIDSQPPSSQVWRTPNGTPSSSRATSEAVDSSQGSQGSQGDEDPGQEDPAVARLRLYLPSIKFTPQLKNGPSRVISLWSEQRGVDPSEYRYRPPGQDSDEKIQEAKRRQEKEERRRQRRAEKRAQLGIRLEGAGESFSQPYRSTTGMSSPVWQPLSQEPGSSQLPAYSQGGGVGSSQVQADSQAFTESSQPQAQSQGLPGFGFGLSQGYRSSQPVSFTKGFGFNPSQTMSQPLAGEFGGRRPKSKKIPKRKAGF